MSNPAEYFPSYGNVLSIQCNKNSIDYNNSTLPYYIDKLIINICNNYESEKLHQIITKGNTGSIEECLFDMMYDFIKDDISNKKYKLKITTNIEDELFILKNTSHKIVILSTIDCIYINDIILASSSLIILNNTVDTYNIKGKNYIILYQEEGEKEVQEVKEIKLLNMNQVNAFFLNSKNYELRFTMKNIQVPITIKESQYIINIITSFLPYSNSQIKSKINILEIDSNNGSISWLLCEKFHKVYSVVYSSFEKDILKHNITNQLQYTNNEIITLYEKSDVSTKNKYPVVNALVINCLYNEKIKDNIYSIIKDTNSEVVVILSKDKYINKHGYNKQYYYYVYYQNNNEDAKYVISVLTNNYWKYKIDQYIEVLNKAIPYNVVV